MKVDIDEDSVLYNKYDQSGQRTVKELQKTLPNIQGGESVHIAKNIYPNSVYEEEISGIEGDEANWQTKKIRHISLGNQTLAHFTVSPQGNVEKILVFGDHLGSSSILTDSMGRVKTLYDYYPFGGTRLDSSDGLHVSAYQYTGKEKDEETGLNYFGARYQNADIGRFTQSDPLTQNLSDDKSLVEKFGKNIDQVLANPQQLNAYSYTINNPIRYIDPDGNSQSPFDGYLKATNKLAKLLGNAIDKAVAYLRSERQNKVNEYAAQYDQLSDEQKEMYGSSEQYGNAMVMQDDTMNVVIGMQGGGVANDASLVVQKVAIKAGDTVAGLKVTFHAAEQFVARSMNKLQIKSALEKGVKYLDTETNNILHVVGERGKGGYTIVTDRAQKVLVSTENFIRNLVPKNSPDRFKLLE